MAVAMPVVLCVEDDYDTREMLEVLLRDHGYDFIGVDSCADALSVLSTQPVSVVLLDNWLPDGAGTDVCREIRRQQANLPVIFFTGAGQESTCLAAGASAFVGKPCRLQELFAVLEHFAPLSKCAGNAESL